MRTIRIVLTNIPVDKEKDLIECLAEMVKKGLLETSDVHMRYDEEV